MWVAGKHTAGGVRVSSSRCVRRAKPCPCPSYCSRQGRPDLTSVLPASCVCHCHCRCWRLAAMKPEEACSLTLPRFAAQWCDILIVD